jgi:hypothetical protein
VKIHPVGAELFYAVRWTEMTKLTVAFRHFANAPKEAYVNSHIHPHQNSKTCMYESVQHDIIQYIFVNLSAFSCNYMSNGEYE